MKRYLILILFCSIKISGQTISDSVSINISLTQPKLDQHEYFRRVAIKSMINSINFDKLIKAPSGFAQLASISIVFNKDGHIDTAIVTTKLNQHFELKKNPTIELRTFKPILDYANTIVILPILYIRMNEVDIDLKNNFLLGFKEIWPPDLLNKKKNIVLLKPEINPFSQIE